MFNNLEKLLREKSSATNSAELFIRLDCGELHEVW